MDPVLLHKRLSGKIEIKEKIKLSLSNLPLVYTPGVAKVAREIAKDPKKSFELTLRKNLVAIVTDGSRTLGVGNTIAEASLPVMEGKALLFKALAKIDAFPICLGTKLKREILKTIEFLAPTFSAFNLEDIEYPKGLEIGDELKKKNFLVFHDDRGGTGIVVFSGAL